MYFFRACCANHARIHVAPWTKSQDIGMGKLAVEYAGDANTVIMKHHGVISFGKDMEEALYATVYLKEAVKTYVMTRIMGAVQE
ncbi:MAG: class II aldolase/adducin family protein [Erysipelotrichaceae bacterium]|nr:class II aldolase/adducin family protein [Erysipelotrichaceae bacterium]